MQLTDQHGRKIRKLRLSLTDKCNLRCHYCMPLDQTFMPEDNYLCANEYREIVTELVALGLEEVRLTGGEPLMRKSFSQILSELSQTGLKKIALTTNGIYLDRYLDLLQDHNVRHLNISLDSLNADTFKRITFGNHLPRILANITEAQGRGFIIKINAVMMKGINDHEVFDFVKYAESTGLEVRFLELMRIGHACGPQSDQFISAGELRRRIEEHYTLRPVVMPVDATSFNYLTHTNAHLGFIASESQAFCGTCSRWRLSADGVLRACLLKDDGVSVKDSTYDERQMIYRKLLGMKPLNRPQEVSHFMNAIGG